MERQRLVDLVETGPGPCADPTSLSGSSKGSGFRRTPWTTLKIAAFAPIPSARVPTETRVNRGDRKSFRRSCRDDERRNAMAMTR
jgi:hypothetical protein